MIIEFEISGFGLPKTTNGSMVHWRIKHAETKKWKRLVFMAVVKNLPPQPFLKAKLTLTRCSSREPDFDGLVSSFKHVIDGLIEAQVLQNDRMSNIGQPTYLWERANLRKGMIKVKIEGIE